MSILLLKPGGERIRKLPAVGYGTILRGHQPTSLFSTHGSYRDHTTATLTGAKGPANPE
jgi:hypothetical protein